MKKLVIRIITSAISAVGIILITQGTALANPSDVTVGVAFKPWYTDVTQSLADVQVTINTVGIPGKVPIQGYPYNGFHLGDFLSPYKNTHSYPNNTAFSGDQRNWLAPGESWTRSTYFPDFAWCGNNHYGPGNLAVGEFEIQVDVAPLAGATFDDNGGRWVAYWQWIGGGGRAADSWVVSNAVRAPANNDNETQVWFVYEEYPPTYSFQGYRIDRFGNAAPQFHNAGSAYTRMNTPAPGLSSNANPYSWTGINATQEHNFTADSTTDWSAVGWAVNYNNGGWGFNNNMSQFTISANGLSNGTTVDSRFFYEPKHASVRAGVKVRDNSSGSIYSPCGSGNYSQAICGTVSLDINQQGTSPAYRPGTQNTGLYGNFANSYTLDTSTTPTNPNSESSVGNLYYGTHRFTMPSVPAGFKIVGWRVRGAWNGSTANSIDVFINPNEQNVSVEPVLEPQTISFRALKKGPGTFINQNSAASIIPNGTVSINGQSSNNNNAVTTTLIYSNSYTLSAQATDGWLVRGYAFCVGNVNQADCTNDGVVGANGSPTNIVLHGNDQASVDIPINYTTTTVAVNGANIVIGNGQELFIAVFFKPKPIDVQVKAWINQQGGSNSNKINPCDQSDYKKQICDDSRIRAVRMNTADGINNNNNPGEDLSDPAGGAFNASCSSTDYIPTKPGYNYTNFGNYFCALKDTGGTTGASGTGFISYGQTLDAATGGISGNANPSENNAAIFRNVYPGKYSFQADDTPDNGGYSSDWTGFGCPTGGESCTNPVVSTPAIGVSGFPELAYDVGQSTCDINTTNCQNTKTVINDSGGCKLDHRRKAQAAYWQPVWWWGYWVNIIGLNGQVSTQDSHGEDKCTIMSGGSAGDNYYASPEAWNPSFNWNAAKPSRCTSDYTSNWWPGAGALGSGTQAGTPCGYYKWATTSVYTYSMGILPGIGIGQNGKALREQNFIYTPKIKTTQGTITCDTYTAKLAFMPDPARPVESYFRIAAPSLTNLLDSSNNPIIVTTPGGNGAGAHDVVLHIPKYNGTGANRLLKDGLSRGFEHFARFGASDPALISGYSASAADWSTGGYKYTPTRVFNGNHVCTNNAICDDAGFDNQLSQYSTIDVDDTSTISLEVNMTNTGQSYWMRNVNENDSNYTTGHQLVVTGGTIRSVNGSQGWVIGDAEMLLPDGSHVYPINPVDDGGNSISGDNTVTFDITPEPPADGGSKFVLGFQMAQNGVAFGTACESDLEIKVSYKPWLRVQNGNVTALGKIQDQSERARGVYKSETSSTTPYKGSVQMNTSGTPPNAAAKPALNLHTQFSVAAEMGGENFCSTNFYMLGIATDPFSPNASQQSRNCDFGSMELNIDHTEDRTSTIDPDDKQLQNAAIYDDVKKNITGGGNPESYGQCEDTQDGVIKEGRSGPYELSQAFKYYRSWWPGSAIDAQDLVWSTPTGPTSFNENPFPNGPFGRVGVGPNPPFNLVNTASLNHRPCPTVFKLTTNAAAGSNPDFPAAHKPLGGFQVSAGRSTILSDDTVYITGNIATNLIGSTYQFKRGTTASGVDAAPDTAGLNSLPNLGIIADGDIVIASSVTEIDASLYATGSIITCDKYALPGGMNEDAGKTDNTGTTGSKWIRHGSSATDANPLKNELEDPNVVEPPTADNDSATGCNSSLKITGSVTAGTSFKFGRNYIDFAGMVTKWGDAQAGAFGLYGKFCNESTATPAANFQRACTVLGARRDFDSPESSSNGYLLEYKAGHPQNYYTGGPAEDFIGNGLASFIPPPGFEDLGGALQSAKYYNNSEKPQF